MDKSLRLLNKIIADNPDDGFLYELKGQILFESSRVKDSVIAYDKAIKLLEAKYSTLSKISFASAILALKTDDEELLKLAIKRLEEAKYSEKKNALLFYQLANAYSKIRNKGLSYLALAEFNLLIDKKPRCKILASKAKKEFGDDLKVERLKADDLIEVCG